MRVAVVTGVSRLNGIGRCIARAFLQAGYGVVGVDIRPISVGDDPVIKAFGDSFLFVQADITRINDLQVLLQAIVKRFGKQIHVLINNAGIADPYLPDRQRVMLFSTILAVNLTAAYTMSEALRSMMVQGDSAIIHISSTRALQSEPNCEAYAAAKSGLLGLTHAQAATLAGITRVNVILPGWIDTADVPGEGLTKDDHDWHWAGRVGMGNDVAHMALFLADSSKSGFITGQQFVVDGGVTRRMHYPEPTPDQGPGEVAQVVMPTGVQHPQQPISQQPLSQQPLSQQPAASYTHPPAMPASSHGGGGPAMGGGGVPTSEAPAHSGASGVVVMQPVHVNGWVGCVGGGNAGGMMYAGGAHGQHGQPGTNTSPPPQPVSMPSAHFFVPQQYAQHAVQQQQQQQHALTY